MKIEFDPEAAERLLTFAQKVAWRCHLLIGGPRGDESLEELDWELETIYSHVDKCLNHEAPS